MLIRLSALQVLGLAFDFSQKELKKAYRTQSRRFHPDKHGELLSSFLCKPACLLIHLPICPPVHSRRRLHHQFSARG
jgi:hypothetical protein